MMLRSANTFQTPFKCQTSFPLTALQKYSGTELSGSSSGKMQVHMAGAN